jgi:Uma2 family endonuclease
MYQRLNDGLNGPLPPSETLPTMYDLPSEDPEEPGLPDEFHDLQPKFLKETCQPKNEAISDFFVGADLNLYYDGRHPLWHKRPDWFLVLGVASATRQEELRWSYVMWQEFVSPYLVVELLSPGTEDEDLGKTTRLVGKPPRKWEVYEQILRVPFYVVYDRYENLLRVFALAGGQYAQVGLTESKFWFEGLGLGIGVWSGIYSGVEGRWLRWYDQAGWIASDQERAEAASQRAEAASQRAEAAERQLTNSEVQLAAERDRAERLAARLRELGIEE